MTIEIPGVGVLVIMFVVSLVLGFFLRDNSELRSKLSKSEDEIRALRSQIASLFELLERYVAVERAYVRPDERKDMLGELLTELKKVRNGGDVNVSVVGQGASVDQASLGKGNAQTQ